MNSETGKIVLGSRGSELALWQTNWVKSELERRFPKLQIEIEIIKTTGDKILDDPLPKIGDKGLFTKEIEHALLEHRIDGAVHSLKDLPTTLPEGLTIGAITRREDVRDVFIAHPRKAYRRLSDLPIGARVATGSLRRKCQLLNWRPDLEIIDIRGNLNTRFAKLAASDWDGMILARAGVSRLGLENRITEILPTEIILPAVGQGAIGVEVRGNDERISKHISVIASESTTIAANGERALLRELEGGCQIPIGAYGCIENNEFVLEAMIVSLDGKKIVRGKIRGIPNQAEESGKQLAQTLLDSGGKVILEQIRRGTLVEVPVV